MRRIVLVVSLGLLIAFAIAWLRSRTRDEGGVLTAGDIGIGAAWYHGLLSIAVGKGLEAPRPIDVMAWSESNANFNRGLHEELHERATSSYSRFNFTISVGAQFAIITMPLWFVMIVSGVPLAMWCRGRMRRRRRKKCGLCLDCGYDLRASTERCPECGASIATAV